MCHQNTHHPSTWDKSDGPFLKYSNPATWTLVPKDY